MLECVEKNNKKVTNVRSIDIHNHIIFGLDDGAKTEDETIQMLKQAADDGIEKIILTPHYVESKYENTKDVIEKKKEAIDQLIEEHHIPIEVYYGCEIYMSDDVLDKVNEGELMTMNGTKYVLVETKRSRHFSKISFDDALYNFRVDGYYPIVAHPERYQMVYENPNRVYNWIEDGCYIQVNATSLLDPKKPSFKVAKKLLDHHLVHFVATDAHDPKYRPAVLSDAYQFVKKRYGADYAELLFYTNPLKLINGEQISTNGAKPVKKKRFFFFF